ncbi:ubiquinol-cytochrome c reductase iron-sulfur subunit [Immundisolibacter sp.]|uniref:ubiquinol-cytochrome c reductase iron-sulfur subunit n=1 Tax=Immundisolibacter sp. TaxID=1934948 RepID=UPI0026145241|nr:ubiquinol-cytochrome c reductase iron-sulfur subunit [Immundisolibacter sp.]MDD3650074.1 ubiquinol-cytochrome c reductase iron-sulfur subunit [Immundisolibacter sp.]
MANDAVDPARRRLLAGTAGALGGVGLAATAVPFISSMQPSAKTQAAGAPVEVDISKLAPGELMVVEWRRRPVWVFRRTQEELDNLAKVPADALRDPDSAESEQPPYAKNPHRSIKPEYLVMLGVCTHLGCSPQLRAEPGELGADWLGGFLCPCHGGRYDLAGRVFKGVPPPLNMAVPPHKYLSDTRIVIGEDQETA